MLKNLSMLKFIFLVAKQMKIRIFIVTLFHTLAYLLYCILSIDFFEQFTETIQITMEKNLSLLDLLQNHFLDMNLGMYWFFCWVMVVLLSGALDVISSYLCSVVYSYSEYFVRCHVIDHMYESKLSGLSNLNESEAENYSDLLAEGVRELIERVTHDVFPAMFFIITGIVKTFFDLGFIIGFILLSFSTTFILIQVLILQRSVKFAKDIANESSKRTSIIVESFRYILYGKMFLAEKFFTDRVRSVHMRETIAWEMYQKTSSYSIFSTYIFNVLTKIFIIGSMVFLFMLPHNNNPISSVYKFSQLISWIMYTLSDRAKDFVDCLQSFIQASNSLKFFQQFDSENIDKKNVMNSYEICIKDLSFMRDNRQIITKFSVNIKEGMIVAVVGKSGSGKSTLFRILNKLNTVENGHVFIGDVDINNISDNQIGDLCTYMDQNDGLINESIKDNIKLGRLGINYEKTIDQTRLRALINRVTDDFVVGMSGKNLSGGEKRRVGIARSLLEPKKILYLDEMNTGIDARTSIEIFNDLLPIVKEHKITTFIIDHYHNITDKTDMVIFFSDKGSYVSTHKELMENNTEYKNNYFSNVSK